MASASSTRAAEDRTRQEEIVVKSSSLSCLWDRLPVDYYQLPLKV